MKEFVYAEVKEEFDYWTRQGLALNMDRGKPSLEQLELSRDLFTALDFDDCIDNGVDARNYGELAGMPSARKYWAELLDIHPDQCFVGGSSSLNMMYDLIAKAWSNGLLHSGKPWSQQPGIKFLCPVPGYDRHFKITEVFGYQLITIPMTPQGPDMDAVEEAVKDPAVKGIWCVPKYSNPDGIIYSDETIRRIASLKPAAPDFLLMWDNAYCIHEFEGDYVPFPDILSICAEAGNPDMVFEFASTSKVTLPGAGVSCFACSEANLRHMEKLLSVQIISFDKVNQQRHVLYLRNKAHSLEIMKRHASVMGPKFRCVTDTLDREIAPLEIASWKRPKGGYFVSLNAMPGTAKRTLALCREAGVTMTGAGATFPYGRDPEDSNIRIAPTYPTAEEMAQATDVFVLCVKLVSVEKLLQEAVAETA